jgi:hypothetical protein
MDICDMEQNRVDKSCENWFSGFSFTHKCNSNITRHILYSCYNATVRRKSNRLCSYKVSDSCLFLSFANGMLEVKENIISKEMSIFSSIDSSSISCVHTKERWGRLIWWKEERKKKKCWKEETCEKWKVVWLRHIHRKTRKNFLRWRKKNRKKIWKFCAR